mmetsp:Transcript_40355/g.106712  ORF Transcript_40355/g.106712 Transcript_40355/m.106712 type:complete len:161 (+) Transcript_40355:153-635(+)
MQVSSIENWAPDGPRTAAWVLELVRRSGGNITSRHTKFVAENHLSRSDPRVTLHGVFSEVMDCLCCVDQLDCTNLVGVECFTARVPAYQGDEGGPRGRGHEGTRLLPGQGETMHGAYVCPELSAWAAERLKTDHEILKQRRKAQELRVLPPSEPPAEKQK